MATVRTRVNVLKLADWDPIILWYAKAVKELQTRKFTDAASWRYQAAIHDYDAASDPLTNPSDGPPPAAEQTRFWLQCQHFSWYFLPWHRMYIAFFEQIVLDCVTRLGGPQDWALPYWNYSDKSNPSAVKLPPAFIAATMPDGSPNPLLVSNRARGNDGGDVGTPRRVDVKACLSESAFEASATGASPGFGGPKTGFNHDSGSMGSLEGVPHGSMHVGVGGWMGAFNTAALDPIFWLHHCNIDRLWEVWLARDSSHKNSTKTDWLTGVSFDFHDASRNIVTLSTSQVLTTTASPLFYKYDDVSDPLAAAPAPPARKVTLVEPIPEMLGATADGISLLGQVATSSLSLSAPTGPAKAVEIDAAPPRMFLKVENITGSGDPTSYAVYVNLPAGADPEENQDLLAGFMPMFGVAEASRDDREHASGSGIHYTFDVTDLVQALQDKSAWDPNNVQLTFVPEPAPSSGDTPAPEASPIQVGRVSWYVA
jgi:tyrosinase